MEEFNNKFKIPSSEFRGKPFWAWNGNLEKEELIRQIHIFKNMGMGGFFCHSRTGLATEYLGDEWFGLINACADESMRAGIETWLYDEDRWPSGTCGGKVTELHENRMKYLRISIVPADEFNWPDSYIAVFSANIDGMSFYNKERLIPPNLPRYSHVIIFTVEEMCESSFYNGATYSDNLNLNTTKHFIDTTHEKYREHCKERFGTTIKGIFTDEPHRGAVMCGFGVGNKSPENLTPYTDMLFSEFRRNFGYDLEDYLPELFLWKNGEKVHPVKWQYMELLQRLFLNNFLKPIYNWCGENGLLLTGHMLHEDSITAQACMIGSVMRAYEYMDYPGVDVLGEHNKNYWIVKQLSSVARQLGKTKLLSELYGCTGWQMTFKNHKDVGDWQALFGINMRCHHLSWYSMEGESKRDYPASISFQSAWWKDYSYIEDYYARLHMLMSLGEPVCDVLVISPVESAWCIIYPKWSWYLQTLDEDMIRIEKCYAELFYTLIGSGVDFDYGDEDIISRYYDISHENGEAILHIGKAKYKNVIVPEMLTIRSSTLDILKRFTDAGGKVFFTPGAPRYIDAIRSDAAERVFKEKTEMTMERILPSLNTQRLVFITDECGKPIRDILVQIRKMQKKYIIAVMNTNRDREYSNVSIKINIGGYLEKWDVRTGNVYLAAQGKDKIVLTADFAQTGEIVYIVTNCDNGYEHLSKPKEIRKISLPYEFEYELTEPNVCVLDFAKYRINNGSYSSEEEILKIDQSVRRSFGLEPRGGEMIQPWCTINQTLTVLGKVYLKFEFFVKDIPENIFLACEKPEEFQITLNGININIPNDPDWWCDKCFKLLPVEINYLTKGLNTLRLECDFKENTNLESVYLIGEFGVELNGRDKIIVNLPRKLRAGDITTQGLPFYGAGVRYRIPNPNISIGSDTKAYLKTEGFGAAYIKTSEHISAFPPYLIDITEEILTGRDIELEYVLTRRNTFGPLHQNPVIVPMYGPESYLTEEEQFIKDGYGLICQGMTSDVFIVLTENIETL